MKLLQMGLFQRIFGLENSNGRGLLKIEKPVYNLELRVCDSVSYDHRKVIHENYTGVFHVTDYGRVIREGFEKLAAYTARISLVTNISMLPVFFDKTSYTDCIFIEKDGAFLRNRKSNLEANKYIFPHYKPEELYEFFANPAPSMKNLTPNMKRNLLLSILVKFEDFKIPTEKLNSDSLDFYEAEYRRLVLEQI